MWPGFAAQSGCCSISSKQIGEKKILDHVCMLPKDLQMLYENSI